MHETEVNDRWEDASHLPEAIREQWFKLSPGVTARTVISWGEHCVECAAPKCYQTCDLYDRRNDQLCRRFAEGTVGVAGVGRLSPSLQKIHFKKWGKLWGEGSLAMLPLAAATRMERLNSLFGRAICALPGTLKMPVLLPWRYRSLRKKWIRRLKRREDPDYFLMELYNPGSSPVRLTVEIRSRAPGGQPPFMAAVTVAPGLQRTCFPFATIQRHANLAAGFDIDIGPSDSESGPLLYFGALDFVRDSSYQHPARLGGCKCVVWDLDNTVWNGILVEDGADALSLKPGIKELFEELDRRGILLSVASKNNPEDVLPVLRRFGLHDYLLKPQISWEPKGQGVRRIAQLLNIGLESLLYVDDSPFERAEVKSVCPEVQVIDAADANWLLWREESQVAATAESARRRSYYLQENQREQAREQSGGDYEAFLRSCEIRVRILPLTRELLPRAHELLQRTNQMNFSGTRYTREQLEQMSGDSNLEIHVIEVCDRFGSYGLVGLAVVDLARGLLTDLAFSCRIQSKRIEHALLSYLLRRHPARPFRARWRKTERNAPAGKVFAEMGFCETGETGGATDLEYTSEETPLFDFITIEAAEPEAARS